MGIDERGRDFAMIDHAQGACADRAVGCYRDPIGEAAIGLDDDEQAFVGVGQFDPQPLPAEQSQPRAKNLPGAQMLVPRG